MFNLFKKKTDNNIYAPVKGKCVDITKVNDVAFSSKMMGDGFGIIPSDTIVNSPANGTLSMIFPTKHAFGIKMENGTELLIHIGIDTVDLNGKGFEALKKVGTTVKHGDQIIKIDQSLFESKKYDLTIMVILTNNNENITKSYLDQMVDKDNIIIDSK